MLVELDGNYYITNKDKIKAGDWFYCSDNTNYAYVFKCIGLTEDTHLKVLNKNVFGGFIANSKSKYGDWAICYSHKIIASTKEIKTVKHLKLNKADIINS